MNTEGYDKLKKLWKRGTDFLGTEYAIMGGAMSWLSESNLVSALSNAGGFGVIACGSMTPDLLSVVIEETHAKTKKPFGVNLITMHPQIDELIDVTLAHNVKYVVLAGGIPSGDSIKKIKEGGAKVICFAPALILAKKLIRSGVDALVVEGSEAGGHIGPVSTSVLAQEILPHISDVPIFVAGGIGRGEVMASYLQMGASGAQLGTMFVCAEESIAHENFKKMFMRGNARDAVTSVQIDKRFPVIPVRALKNSASIEFMDVQREVINKYQSGELEMEAAQLEIEHYWAGALKRAVIDGDVENGSVMAGQSVGMVKKIQPVSEILENLVQQAANQLA
ncbi:nitronate monooxygenase [Emcibacteraceae bacterium]|nr:nitronate monooxygenase [Emcibacteraceae bacterium]MDA9553248.1 nitronate monooxygenase [Emcibacteraceae bacterium]MDA9770021.1 nitronate monooxygenase [Emcibacteraceae bacterium]MDC1090283.1 nitronate monooxygenase [Emcibacteraceae bacterium]